MPLCTRPLPCDRRRDPNPSSRNSLKKSVALGTIFPCQLQPDHFEEHFVVLLPSRKNTATCNIGLLLSARPCLIRWLYLYYPAAHFTSQCGHRAGGKYWPLALLLGFHLQSDFAYEQSMNSFRQPRGLTFTNKQS